MPRSWRAYEYVALPTRNRTLDSEVMGMNVGLVVNDTRLEVQVDFGNQSEAQVRHVDGLPGGRGRGGLGLVINCGGCWQRLVQVGVSRGRGFGG